MNPGPNPTHTTHRNGGRPMASSGGPAHSLRRRIGALLLLVTALVASITMATSSDARANTAPYIAVDVTDAGDLRVKVLRTDVRAEVFQSGPNGYSIWVYYGGDLVDLRYGLGVTGNVTFFLEDRSQVNVGTATSPVAFPANVRFVDPSASIDESTTRLTNTTVEGDIRYSLTNDHYATWESVTVGSDVVFKSNGGYFSPLLRNTYITERLRLIAPSGSVESSFTNIRAGNTFLSGGDGEDRHTISEASFDTVWVRTKGGNDDVVIDNIWVDLKLDIRTHDGQDAVTLDEVTADRLKVLMGDGQDQVDASLVSLTRPEKSKLIGNGGFDTLTSDGIAEQVAAYFEEIIEPEP